MYAIYNPETTRILRIIRKGYWQDAIYSNKAAATRAFRALTPEQQEQLTYGPIENLRAIEKTEIRHGVGPAHGKTFEVSVNTSWTSGPWSDAYWQN